MCSGGNMFTTMQHLEPRVLFVAGAPDPFFNSTDIPGVTSDDVPNGNNEVAGVAVTDRGGSVVVSTFRPKNGKPARVMVEVFQPGGVLEPTFGTNGRVEIRIGSRGTLARGVAIDDSGR